MRIDEPSDKWTALRSHDWPEHARLTEPLEGDSVRVIPGEEVPVPPRPEEIQAFDDGARLDTPEARRFRTIQDMTDWLGHALGYASRAYGASLSIGYHREVVEALEQSIQAIDGAAELIAIHES